MPFNSRWFKGQLEDLGLSQRQFAKRMKLDPASVTLMFQGKRKLKTEEAAQMSRLFGVEVAEILEQAGVKLGESVKDAKVAVRGVGGDGLMVSWSSVKGAQRGANEFIRAADSFPPGTEAIRLETAGTPYDGVDGGAVFYRPKPGINADAIGRLAVVTMKDGRSAIRVLRRGYSSGKYNLAGLSGEILEKDVELISAWPVLAMKL